MSEYLSTRRVSLTDEQMAAELTITFRITRLISLPEWGPKHGAHGGFVVGTEGQMPDGEPMFTELPGDDDGYDGFIHKGFSAWLEARGWAYDAYDGGTFFLVPLSYFDEPKTEQTLST